MAKGDWEVYEDSDSELIEIPVHQMSPCEMYGHTFETVTDDEGQPLIFGTEFMRKCNDCGDTYTYDPEDETENPNG